MHQLILSHKTGTPDEFAANMCMSRRQLYRSLDDIRELGAEISYSKTECSFYYENRFGLNVVFEVTELRNHEVRNLVGGMFYYGENVLLCHNMAQNLTFC